jgi:hypothetical protein
MGFSFLPKEDEYFTFFSQMTAKMQEASNQLVELTQDNFDTFETHAKKIKDAEHACDTITHEITVKLNKSFITPFDREDIYTMSVALDDVVDYIDAAARAIIMYRITDISEHAKHLAKVIQSLSIEINSAVSMLSKPDNLNQHIKEIHRLENEADDVYFRAIGELFQNTTDAISLIKWKELYEIMENATDRCESVANIIESIMLKHT